MNALRLATLLAALRRRCRSSCPIGRSHARPAAGPTRQVDPKVPQPGQNGKIFPLGSSWVAVSLNGKAFTGERPSFKLDDQLTGHGLLRLQHLSGAAYPLREQGLRGRPLRADEEELRQDRHGDRAGLSRGAALFGQMGHPGPQPDHPDPERRRAASRALALSHSLRLNEKAGFRPAFFVLCIAVVPDERSGDWDRWTSKALSSRRRPGSITRQCFNLHLRCLSIPACAGMTVEVSAPHPARDPGFCCAAPG